MTEIVSNPNWGDDLIVEGRATPVFQAYLDEITLQLNGNLLGNAVVFQAYAVADVPDATIYTTDTGFGVIIVTDEVGGRTLATSDGADWRRVSDGAVISV